LRQANRHINPAFTLEHGGGHATAHGIADHVLQVRHIDAIACAGGTVDLYVERWLAQCPEHTGVDYALGAVQHMLNLVGQAGQLCQIGAENLDRVFALERPRWLRRRCPG